MLNSKEVQGRVKEYFELWSIADFTSPIIKMRNGRGVGVGSNNLKICVTSYLVQDVQVERNDDKESHLIPGLGDGHEVTAKLDEV